MKNKTKNEKLVECPECLGVGVEYDPTLEKDKTCKLCGGKGKIEEKQALSFAPLIDLQQIEEDFDGEEIDY